MILMSMSCLLFYELNEMVQLTDFNMSRKRALRSEKIAAILHDSDSEGSIDLSDAEDNWPALPSESESEPQDVANR